MEQVPLMRVTVDSLSGVTRRVGYMLRMRHLRIGVPEKQKPLLRRRLEEHAPPAAVVKQAAPPGPAQAAGPAPGTL